MGTFGGERVCLKLDSAKAKPTDQTVRRFAKQLEAELGFQQVYYNPKESYEGRVWSKTVLSNSKDHPGWELLVDHTPQYFNLECRIRHSTSPDSSNTELAKRVTEIMQKLFPGAAPYDCTICRGIAAP